MLIQVKCARAAAGMMVGTDDERGLMHTVIWTITPNEGTSRQDMLDELEVSKRDYAGGTGLRRMLLGLSPDGKSVIEISLWDSKAAADAFFTRTWETALSRRWQAAPMKREEWHTLAEL
jgi:hypothetical protein